MYSDYFMEQMEILSCLWKKTLHLFSSSPEGERSVLAIRA